MSILDTFYLLFESDASALDKGLEETRKKGEKLTHQIGAVDKAAEKMGGSVMHALAELGGAVAAAFAVHTLTENIFAAADAADTLGKVADRLGANVEEVSAWGDAIGLAGGSAEGFAGSLDTLSASLSQMDVTGKSRVAPFLKELGIDLDDVRFKGKSAMELLPAIADSFEGLSKQQSLGIGRKLGLDQGTIMFLQAGRREIEAQIAKQKELGVITAEQAKVSAEYNDSVDMAKHAFRSLWLEVAMAVLPAFKAVAEMFQGLGVWMRKHSGFVVGLLIALGAAIAFYVIPPLLSAAAAAIVAFGPFILLGAIVAALATAFALLYEDIMIFMEGGDSAIGHIVENWPIVGDILKALGAEFVFLWDVAKAVWGFLVGMFDDPAAAFEQFKSDISAGIDRLIATFPGLKEVIGTVTDAFSLAGETITSVWDAVIAAVKAAIAVVMDGVNTVVSAFNKAKSFLGFGGGESAPSQAPESTREALARGKEQLGAASSSPLVSQTSNSISNSAKTSNRTTQVSVGKVEVKTAATDAEGISKAIGGSMQAQMRQAASNYDDGVLA